MNYIKTTRKILVVLFIFSILFQLSSCNFSWNLFETTYQTESIANLTSDKDNQNPYFLRMDLLGPESYPEEVIDFTVYTHENDSVKDLFKITSNGYVEKMPEIIEDDKNIYMYFSGIKAESSLVYDFDKTDDQLTVLRYDSSPFIAQYNKETGEVSEIKVKNPDRTIILDAFSYNDKLIYLAEKRTKSYLVPIAGTWKESTGYMSINNKELKFPIIGSTALNIKGCLVGDEYYFPAISGIYKIDLKTNKVHQCLETNYGNFDYVQIVHYNNEFIIIQEGISSYGHKPERDFTSSIVRYTSDFEQVNSANLDIRIDNVVCGANGAMVSERMYNYISTVFQKALYVDFDTFDTKVTSEHYICDGNYVSPYWYYDESSNKFLLIDTNSEECKISFENGEFIFND